MPFSEEQIHRIVDLAKKGFPNRIIALKMGIPLADFYDEVNSKALKELIDGVRPATELRPMKVSRWYPLPRHLQEIKVLAACGHTMEDISVALGLCAGELEVVAKQCPAIVDAFEIGNRQAISAATSGLMDGVRNGDIRSIIHVLKSRDPKNWSDRPPRVRS